MNAAPASIPPATPNRAATLRRIGLLRPGGGLLRCGRLLLGGRLLWGGLGLSGPRGGTYRFPRDPLPWSAGADGRLRRLPLRGRLHSDRAQGALQVVENEADGRIRCGRRCDPGLPLRDDEDASLLRRRFELSHPAIPGFDPLCVLQQPPSPFSQAAGAVLVERRSRDLALVVEDDGSLDLGRDLGQVGESLLRVHCRYSIFRRVRFRRRDLWRKFYADRGPHLAAMIAYFALLAFVPLTFLSLSLLGLAGRADESSFLVREIKKTLPGTPIDQIVNLVHAVQDNAATLGIIGGLALLWTSLSLFSVLESALNIVYGRPNRSFLQGKGLAFLVVVGSLVA